MQRPRDRRPGSAGKGAPPGAKPARPSAPSRRTAPGKPQAKGHAQARMEGHAKAPRGRPHGLAHERVAHAGAAQAPAQDRVRSPARGHAPGQAPGHAPSHAQARSDTHAKPRTREARDHQPRAQPSQALAQAPARAGYHGAPPAGRAEAHTPARPRKPGRQGSPAPTGHEAAERPPAAPRTRPAAQPRQVAPPGRAEAPGPPQDPAHARTPGSADPTPSRERRGPAHEPRGTVWLHGQHAVAAALANPARRPRRLLLTAEARTALAARLPPPWPLAPEHAERGRLDQLLGRDVVHQGTALLADLLTPPGLAETLARPGPVLVLDQVTDPRNVGAILRSAAAFGACAVLVQDRNAPEETGALAKAASGALETVPLLRAVNLARTLGALQAAGLWVVGLEADATQEGGAHGTPQEEARQEAPPAHAAPRPNPLDGSALAERRVALVLGAEGAGLRRLTRESCDELASLAMPGGMESLNVAAAAAVALYELARR